MYEDSVVGGGDEEFEDSSIKFVGVTDGDENGVDGENGTSGVREAFDEDLENKDVSYAIVASNI